MFTGIIEEIGEIIGLRSTGENLELQVSAIMAPELRPDQSISHNGVCLTVEKVLENAYTVTAIKETLEKTTLKLLKVGERINLERGMKLGSRLDGHIVQGHVDQTAVCTKIKQLKGSREFTFDYDSTAGNYTIEKGSITINGVSLTVVGSEKDRFRVAVIPYTLDHTTFKILEKGQEVNLEFDVIGKYVKRLMELGN